MGGQPDDSGENEHCLEYVDSAKKMNDRPCDARIGVSCRFFGPFFNFAIVGYNESEFGCQTNEIYQRKGMNKKFKFKLWNKITEIKWKQEEKQ